MSKPMLFGFCGGFQSPANHERCPGTIRNSEKSWTCQCPCHEEKK